MSVEKPQNSCIVSFLCVILYFKLLVERENCVVTPAVSRILFNNSSWYTFCISATHLLLFSAPCRKLKEVHKRLNELRELVQYYEQTSDMMVDAVNENVKEDDDDEEDEEEEDETEDGSIFEAMFDSEQENRQPVTNIRCVCLNRLIN